MDALPYHREILAHSVYATVAGFFTIIIAFNGSMITVELA